MKKESGFTLVELAVVMLLAMVLGSLIYGVYLFLNREVVRWRQDVALQNDMHLMISRLAQDFTAADWMEQQEDTTWILHFIPQDTVRYSFRNKTTLWRNDRRMHDLHVSVRQLDIYTSTPYVRYSPAISEAEEAGPVEVRLKLVLKNNHRQLSTATAVTRRIPRPWRSLR